MVNYLSYLGCVSSKKVSQAKERELREEGFVGVGTTGVKKFAGEDEPPATMHLMNDLGGVSYSLT